ncbi:MAG: S8 family serine peptidase [Chlorobi bacterium]|nr:S8 family serine peptidase [Chlorobiota bacterium]
MKKTTLALIAILIVNFSFSQENHPYSKNELIVHFKENTKINLGDCTVLQKFGEPVLDGLNQQYLLDKIVLTGNRKTKRTYILKFTSEQEIEKLAKTYLGTGFFEYVEPNFMGKGSGQKGISEIFPNDTYFSRQWGLYNDGTFSLSPAVEDADIDMELAWDTEQGDTSIVVAILDTGVKLDHPELEGRIWANYNETVNGSDDDGNGYVDDVMGWDFANVDNNPMDDFGHGTNVTGIIGANTNNEIGYAGVDWNCKLMIGKILDQNNWGYYSWWADGIYYAVDNGADVINMSVGGSSYSNLMDNAIEYAHSQGVIVVASMMNTDNNVVFYPVGYEQTIAVGSTNPNDERSSPFFWDPASGSNYGDHIDVVAPGNFIYGLDYESDTNYEAYWGGTSQATPLVTGLCALLLAQDSTRTPDEIREIVRNTAEDEVGDPTEDTPGFDIFYGHGRINANEALLQLPVNIAQSVSGGQTFSVYPNPATDYLFISGSLNKKRICIINSMGTRVFEQETANMQDLLKVDVSGFPRGIYFVQITDNKGSTSKKIIIE